jgi:hypothetical protein
MEPQAKAMFDILTAQNRYAVLYRVTSAKRPETRASRIAQFVAMLARGETVLRLPLGAEAVRNLTRVYRGALDDVEKWASVSESADFPGMPPAVRAF